MTGDLISRARVMEILDEHKCGGWGDIICRGLNCTIIRAAIRAESPAVQQINESAVLRAARIVCNEQDRGKLSTFGGAMDVARAAVTAYLDTVKEQG